MVETLRETDSYILFELAGTTYGVPSGEVQHMEMAEQITPVPNAEPHVEGVVFSLGEVVPVVNLRLRFGFSMAVHTNRSRMIIMRAGTRRVRHVTGSAPEIRQ